jgi:hypothetical protein
VTNGVERERETDIKTERQTEKKRVRDVQRLQIKLSQKNLVTHSHFLLLIGSRKVKETDMPNVVTASHVFTSQNKNRNRLVRL